jgi:hypothetical protein
VCLRKLSSPIVDHAWKRRRARRMPGAPVQPVPPRRQATEMRHLVGRRTKDHEMAPTSDPPPSRRRWIKRLRSDPSRLPVERRSGAAMRSHAICWENRVAAELWNLPSASARRKQQSDGSWPPGGGVPRYRESRTRPDQSHRSLGVWSRSSPPPRLAGLERAEFVFTRQKRPAISRHLRPQYAQLHRQSHRTAGEGRIRRRPCVQRTFAWLLGCQDDGSWAVDAGF